MNGNKINTARKKASLRMVLTVAALLLCILPMGISHAAGSSQKFTKEGENGAFHYGIKKDGTIGICYYYGLDQRIVIPAKIKGRRVTSIESSFTRSSKLWPSEDAYDIKSIDYPSEKKTGIKSVVVPEGVTRIESGAFENMGLSGVKLPKSLVYIGKNAFAANQFKSIRIPDRVKVIGNGAFSQCFNLVNVKLPKNLVKIGTQAFCGDYEIKSICIPAKTVSIGEEAFYECSKLGKIEIQSKRLKKVGKDAFYATELRPKVKVPASKKEAYKKLLKNTGLDQRVKIFS